MTPDMAIGLLVRIASTAAIVIVVTLAVERLGPKIGGTLGGLPIVIGPAFFFLLREHSVAFSADAAAASLLSLSATQAFLLGYIAVAARSRAAILAATLAWVVCALSLSRVPPSPLVALLIFLFAMIAARGCASRFVRPIVPGSTSGTLTLLIARGMTAGLLVAGVTVASDWLGSVWAGFLMTYPIGLTVISVTIHQRSGADTAIVTLRALMTGISSLAAFAFGLAVLLEPLGQTHAFALALLASVLVTVGLINAPLTGR